MPIHILPPEVAAKIAAGEVVERPASVVKELIENSLDAGATRVTVEVQGGGSRLIRVADNGSGMEPEDLPLALHRHATSKIATAEDLEAIATLGFRGEALASIAAVAEVNLVSRPAHRLAGAFIRVRGGQEVERGARGCPAGTTVSVGHLFANVPARLKFLRSPGTEAGHISHLVNMYALAFPQVRFSLSLEGRTTFQSPGNGGLRDVAARVYGAEAAAAMLEVSSPPEVSLGVRGLVSPPSLSRASRGGLCFFINRRWVQSRMLAYAVEEAYHGLLMAGRHPIAVLHIDIPPREVDVNVHPAKAEVRFQDEGAIFTAAQRAVRGALVELAPVPSVRPVTPPPPAPPPLPLPHLHPTPAQAAPHPHPLPAPAILRVLGQIQKAYIIAEGEDGMYLIDQHTAHERLLFDRLRGQKDQGEIQALLEPLPLELSPRQAELWAEHREALAGFGFLVEPFGDRSYLLRGMPALLRGREPGQALKEVLDSLGEPGPAAHPGEEVAISLACHGAVRAGQALSLEEMRELVRQLEAASLPRTCPHGRPILLHLSSELLEREFGRR